ncbi:MAG: hypothetical protein ACRDDY_01350 [Clostridium sp.]|uniref:hypothetical protein n=1 Tax=Clostridium sp. TaxID=1506 RepID=UPI003EE523B3
MKQIFIISLLYLIILLDSLIFPILHQTMDFTYTIIIGGILRNILKYLSLGIYSIKELKNKEKFYKFFIYSCCLNIGTTILFILCPAFKEMWINNIYISELNYKLIQEQNYITRFSLVGFTGFKESFLITIGIVFNMYLFLKEGYNLKNSLTLFMLFLGSLFYGRVAILTSLLILLLFCIYEIIIRKKIKLLFNFLVCSIFLFVIIFLLKDYNSKLNNWIIWISDPINKFLNNGSFGYSGDTLIKKMIFIPKTVTFLLGDGKYTNSDMTYYMHTDSGIMRPILFYGIFNQILSYLIVIILITNSIKYKLIKFLLILMFILFEVKGEVFYIFIGILSAIFFVENNSLNKKVGNKYNE